MEEIKTKDDESQKEQDKKFCVYMHTNKINDKVYIGITCQKPQNRWGRDGKKYTQGKHRVFARAINAYGWDNFKHEILFENLTEFDAKQKEIELIALHKANICRWGKEANGYNLTDGGDGTTGYKFTDEQRERMSKTWKEKFKIPGYREEFIRKIKETWPNGINPRHGAITPEETRRKISESKIKKSVIQIDLNGDFIAEFKSISEAAKLTKIDGGDIIKCCKNKKNTAGGFMWTYKEFYDEDIVYTHHDDRFTPVLQFDTEGNLMMEYKSVAEAARQTNTNDSNIRSCCLGVIKSANGYIWRHKTKYNNSDVVSYERDSVRQVVQIDRHGVFVAEHPTVTIAAESVGVDGSSISACCRGKIKSCKGFMWKYKEDYDPQATLVYEGKDLFSEVVQLDFDGNLIAEYPSTTIASKCVDIPSHSISDCCNGSVNSAGGYIWVRKVDYDSNKNYSYCNQNAHSVVQLSLSGKFVKKYQSLRIAEKETGIKRHDIAECCKNRREQVGGFKWVYAINYKQIKNKNI